MLTAARAIVGTAKSAGLLPAFGWVLLAVALLTGGGGTWLGMRWEKGTQAIADAKALRDQAKADRDYINELQAAGKRRQQGAVDQAKATTDAFNRQDEIASRLENTLNANDAFRTRQQNELANLLARRPDLRDLRLGNDVLQHWNESNAGRAAGSGTAAPAAGPAGKPAAAMPRAPAGAKRPGAGSAGQPRPGGGAVSGLQSADEQPARLDRRVGANRLVLVLRRARPDAPGRRAVPEAGEVRQAA